MNRTLYLTILWVLIVAGLVPALYFLWSWRPRRRWSATQLDAGGWVAIIAGLYLLAAFRAATGGYSQPRTIGQEIATFTLGAGIDAVLWLRVIRWRSFRRGELDHPLRRCTDPAVDDTGS